MENGCKSTTTIFNIAVSICRLIASFSGWRKYDDITDWVARRVVGGILTLTALAAVMIGADGLAEATTGRLAVVSAEMLAELPKMLAIEAVVAALVMTAAAVDVLAAERVVSDVLGACSSSSIRLTVASRLLFAGICGNSSLIAGCDRKCFTRFDVE